jgi:hypothetical protein
MRKPLGTTAATVLASLSLLAIAAAAASAAPLSAAARFEPQRPIAADSDLHEVRHRYRHYGGGYYYGPAPFTLNDYAPYVYAHPPRYDARPSRAVNRSCRYWSGRCAANWGSGNNNYYGCLRYHGC